MRAFTPCSSGAEARFAMASRWSTVLASPLRTLADACVFQPLSAPVPADDAAFAARKGMLRLAVRTARRAWLLRLSGQTRWLTAELDPGWRRLLWIHEGMPQIGDALMDLAPRSLLVERGIHVDLFAAPHIAALFEHDAWFTRSLSQPCEVGAQDYDAAIVMSHDRKSLAIKRARLPALPWVSIQGFYGGPDFHRGRFSAQRIADLLRITLSPDALAWHARQKLCLKHDTGTAPDAPRVDNAIAFAMGGVHAERTYHRWPELVKALAARGIRRFILVGARNGRESADRLIACAGADVEVLDRVGRTSLSEAQRLFDGSAAVVCPDGGLMHLALTTSAPVVAMFSSAIQPDWRLPAPFVGAALQSPTTEVDGISPEVVADAVQALLGQRSRARPALSNGV